MATNGAPDPLNVLGVVGQALVAVSAWHPGGKGRPCFAAVVVGDLAAITGEDARPGIAMHIEPGDGANIDRLELAIRVLLADATRHRERGAPHSCFQHAAVTITMKGAANG